MTETRNAALDFSRFAAAAIVFLGHMLFLPSSYLWNPQTTNLLDPVRTGATAVMFFFALSGYVLAVSNRETDYFNWIRRRLIRLFPVYITAWSTGLMLLVLSDLPFPNSAVLILGASGVSAINPRFNLITNPPLWSLSVEIIFALTLFYFLKLKNKPRLLICVLPISIAAPYFFADIQFLRVTPYFLIGILLRNQWCLALKVNQIIAAIVLLIIVITYIFNGASYILAIPYSIGGETLIIILIGTLIFLLSRIEVYGVLAKFSIAVGKRSFCLYAFHYPVLLIFNYLVKPYNKISMGLYIILSISVTLCVTELSYRYIDMPSTKYAQKLKK